MPIDKASDIYSDKTTAKTRERQRNPCSVCQALDLIGFICCEMVISGGVAALGSE